MKRVAENLEKVKDNPSTGGSNPNVTNVPTGSGGRAADCFNLVPPPVVESILRFNIQAYGILEDVLNFGRTDKLHNSIVDHLLSELRQERNHFTLVPIEAVESILRFNIQAYSTLKYVLVFGLTSQRHKAIVDNLLLEYAKTCHNPSDTRYPFDDLPDFLQTGDFIKSAFVYACLQRLKNSNIDSRIPTMRADFMREFNSVIYSINPKNSPYANPSNNNSPILKETFEAKLIARAIAMKTRFLDNANILLEFSKINNSIRFLPFQSEQLLNINNKKQLILQFINFIRANTTTKLFSDKINTLITVCSRLIFGRQQMYGDADCNVLDLFVAICSNKGFDKESHPHIRAFCSEIFQCLQGNNMHFAAPHAAYIVCHTFDEKDDMWKETSVYLALEDDNISQQLRTRIINALHYLISNSDNSEITQLNWDNETMDVFLNLLNQHNIFNISHDDDDYDEPEELWGDEVPEQLIAIINKFQELKLLTPPEKDLKLIQDTIDTIEKNKKPITD